MLLISQIHTAASRFLKRRGRLGLVWLVALIVSNVDAFAVLLPAAQIRPHTKSGATSHVVTQNKGSITRVVSADQHAENMYRDAVALIQEGRMEDAQTLLLDGIKISPQRPEFFMALAHVHLTMNDVDAAIKTMEEGLPAAASHAEFHALFAALLQRTGRHDEAIAHYVIAIRLKPDSANWFLGLGISLQAKKDESSAVEAYQRAIELGLSPSLMQFTQERLRQLNK